MFYKENSFEFVNRLQGKEVCCCWCHLLVACANYSLQSYFFQKEFFCELIGVRKLNMNFTLSVSCYLKRLEKTFSQFQDKNINVR